MERWEQNDIQWYNQEIAKGTIQNMGTTYESGPQFFVIPKWVSEEYGIKTVFDMTGYSRLFNGAFINCITGWRCTEINKVKLEAYGLTDHYTIVSPGSGAALEATLANAQENREPVFGY